MRTWLGILASLAALSCGGESEKSGADTGAQRTACDPLLTVDVPTELGDVLAVGRDSEGTVYVLDRGPDEELRVFVSMGESLFRKEVVGSGEGDGWYVLSVADPDFELKVEGSGEAMQIGIIHGDCACKTFDVAAADEVLEVLPQSAANAFGVENLPGEVLVDFWAAADDGRRLLVSRSRYDSNGELRLFFGPSADIAERRVESVSRDWSTYITFDLDGSSAVAFIPGAESDPTDGLPYLSVGDVRLTLTPGEPALPTESDRFSCFAR
jgi:hypothetical protein